MSQSTLRQGGVCPGVFLAMVSVPFLFVAALAASTLGLLPFETGIHTLVTIVAIFIIFLFFIPHNASYAACRISRNFELMEQDLQEGLKGNALTIMGKTKSTLTVREFIEEYFKDIRDDNYARVAATIFPMLGILGTFVAIAVSMPDFTVTSSEKLDRQISLLLAGIGTAFYASIYGIFLSLWWIFFERRGLARIERQVLELEALYNSRIWSRSELVKHEHMQSELKDQKIIRTLQETFNLDFIKDMNAQYMKNYQRIVEDTSRSFALLADRMQEASEDLRQTLSMLQGRKEAIEAEEALRRNIEQFTRTAQTLERGLEHFDESLERSLEKIDFELAGAVERLGRITEMIARQRQQAGRREPVDPLFDDEERGREA
ncbi:MotA/TolQ/ExbB proton channel family protein [Nitratifractor sp.]